MCGHACVWKPEVHALSLPQLVSILFLDMSSLMELQACRLGRPASCHIPETLVPLTWQ